MPYIDSESRQKFEVAIQMIGQVVIKTPGELNYILSRIGHLYTIHKGLSYTTINDVLGAFSGAEKEYYRQVAENYEDDKKKLNGHVSELDK